MAGDSSDLKPEKAKWRDSPNPARSQWRICWLERLEICLWHIAEKTC